MVHQMGRGLCRAPRVAGGADAEALRPKGSPLGGQEKATRFSSLQPSQRNRSKPWARIPQARNASNSSVTNVGRPDPLVSVSTQTVDAIEYPAGFVALGRALGGFDGVVVFAD